MDKDKRNSSAALDSLSTRALSLRESSTTLMAARARAMREAGLDVVDLSMGVPDFDTPKAIKESAFSALEAGYTRYSPMAGIPLLRKAVAEKLQRENGLEYSPEEIVISNGVKQALANACFAVLEPDDEVIIVAPFWSAYPSIVRFAGGKPIIVQSNPEENFHLNLDRIADAVTSRTKLIMLNTPSNPSGAVYKRAELEGLISICRDTQRALILSDEIYESIVFDGEHISPASLPGGRECTIVLNGLSKSFAMTGWRVGYSAAPLPISSVLAKVQGVLTAGANNFVQHAAAFALREMSAVRSEMCSSYLARRDLLVALLREIEGVEVFVPEGTFYTFPDMRKYLGRKTGDRVLHSTSDLVDYFLEEALVSVVPGSAFGNEHCIRITFAASSESLCEGVKRIKEALSRLS